MILVIEGPDHRGIRRKNPEYPYRQTGRLQHCRDRQSRPGPEHEPQKGIPIRPPAQNLGRQDERDGAHDPDEGTAHGQRGEDTNVEQHLQRTPYANGRREDRLGRERNSRRRYCPRNRNQRDSPLSPPSQTSSVASRQPEYVSQNCYGESESQTGVSRATLAAHEANSRRIFDITIVPWMRVVPGARAYRRSISIR